MRKQRGKILWLHAGVHFSRTKCAICHLQQGCAKNIQNENILQSAKSVHCTFKKNNKKTPQNSPWAYPQTFCQKNEFDEFIQDALSTTACPFQPPRERATLYLLRTRLDVTGSRGPTLARARVTSARFFPDSNAPGSRKTQAPPPDWGQQQKSMEIILFPDVCKIFQSEF